MINLALVGVGKWGKNFISTINAIPDCKLKYICAQSKETLDSLSPEYIKTQSYKDLLKYSDIDGIIIASSGSTHFEIASEFLRAGKNILIEKPLTTNLEQAIKLKELYQIKKPVVMAGHIYLYNPAILKIKELLKDLGDIHYITFEGVNSGMLRDDMSVLWEWAPHGISICLDFMKQTPIAVAAWTVSSGMFLIRLEFPNKTIALIKGSWVSPLKRRELIVVGSKKAIIFDDMSDKKITLIENFDSFLNKEDESLKSYPSYNKQLPLTQEVLEFIDCVKNKNNPRTDLDHAIEVIKIIDLAEKSAIKDGQSLTLT